MKLSEIIIKDFLFHVFVIGLTHYERAGIYVDRLAGNHFTSFKIGTVLPPPDGHPKVENMENIKVCQAVTDFVDKLEYIANWIPFTVEGESTNILNIEDWVSMKLCTRDKITITYNKKSWSLTASQGNYILSRNDSPKNSMTIKKSYLSETLLTLI